MNSIGITFSQDCLIGASNPILRYWCTHTSIIFQGGVLLFVVVLIVSIFVGKKKGRKWGVVSFIGGTGIVVLISVLTQILVTSIIWG